MALPTALPHKLSVDSSDVTRVTITVTSSALLSLTTLCPGYLLPGDTIGVTGQNHVQSLFRTLVWYLRVEICEMMIYVMGIKCLFSSTLLVVLISNYLHQARMLVHYYVVNVIIDALLQVLYGKTNVNL